MQGRLRRRIDMAWLDLAMNGEACASARGQADTPPARSIRPDVTVTLQLERAAHQPNQRR